MSAHNTHPSAGTLDRKGMARQGRRTDLDPLSLRSCSARSIAADLDTLIAQKFHASSVDLTCCIMITDTKRTWAEGGFAFVGD